MDEHERTQPETISKPVENYLNMTAPRTRPSVRRPSRRAERQHAKRPPIDNRGLGLEEGNDFA